MNLIELIFLSLALAMDCFAVSVICGIITQQKEWATTTRPALLFGFFQGFMPLLGWLLTHRFRTYIESFDHWIAFLLLLFIGGKMIIESFEDDSINHSNPKSFKYQITLAIATSIDALAVGISFACIGYNHLSTLILPISIIAIGSFAMSMIGNTLGIKYGKIIIKRIKPELVGGIILVLIGIKILVQHLC